MAVSINQTGVQFSKLIIGQNFVWFRSIVFILAALHIGSSGGGVCLILIFGQSYFLVQFVLILGPGSSGCGGCLILAAQS